MKKNYIKPTIGRECLEASSLMTASWKHIKDVEAAHDASGDAVNFSREGSFWDETE